MKYQPIETAPKDGTWILLRGRNSVGKPMVPVVAAWRSGITGTSDPTWRDSASLGNVSHLAHDAGADWCPLPDKDGRQKASGIISNNDIELEAVIEGAKRAFATLVRAAEAEGFSVMVNTNGEYSLEKREDGQ